MENLLKVSARISLTTLTPNKKFQFKSSSKEFLHEKLHAKNLNDLLIEEKLLKHESCNLIG